MTRLGDDTVHSFDHGRNGAVGTSAVRLTTASLHAARGVQLKAATTNTGTLYVGNSDVTAGTAEATDGFPLGPGDALFLPIDDPSKVFLIASAASQAVFFIVL
jgi:hypothetical protein